MVYQVMRINANRELQIRMINAIRSWQFLINFQSECLLRYLFKKIIF